MKRKGFVAVVVILIVVIVLAVAGGIWYYEAHQTSQAPQVGANPSSTPTGTPITTPVATTTNPTSGSVTYRDPNGNFSFQYTYPEDFSVDSQIVDQYSGLQFMGQKGVSEGRRLISMMATSSNPFPNTSLNYLSVAVGYSTSTNEYYCDTISAEQPSGAPGPSSTFGGNLWFEGTMINGNTGGAGDGSRWGGVLHDYYTYHNNACWIMGFNWTWDLSALGANGSLVPSKNPPPSDTDIATFEQSILNTFSFLK